MHSQDHPGAIVTEPRGESPTAQVDRLRGRLEREKSARLEAEDIAESATRELYRKQMGLRLLQEIAVASNEAKTVDAAMQAAIDRVCAHTGWPIGHLYLRDPGMGSSLAPAKLWYLADPERFANFREVTEATRLESGVGLPGRVLATGTPHWIADVTKDSNFPRADVASDIGLRAAFGAPILVEAEVVGVLEFFTDLAVEPDPSLLEIMFSVGTQLGRVIERQRAEEEMRAHRDHLEETVAERTAALSVAYKELEGFSYSVSHDLRAPLRSMDGFSQALLEDHAEHLEPEALDYLHRIRGASQRMAELIDDLLDLSRVARSDMQRGDVDLSGLAQAVADELRALDPDRKVTFAIEEGLRADADEVLLRLVIENLLGNAWKFTSKHLQATIEVLTVSDDGETAFCIRDDGAGFDMDHAGKLFGAFQRLHATAEFEGTGVGLATVQRVVHRHGGRIWAEGKEEGGAAFYFTLPPGGSR